MKHLLLILLAAFLQVGTHAQQDTLIGTAGMDIPHGILGTQDGGYIVYGRTDGSGLGQEDFFLSKYTAADNVLWSYTYGSSGIENGHAINLVQVASGDLYLVGNWEQNIGDQDRAALIKLNSDGDILWKRLLVGTGGVSADTFHSVQEIPDGNLLVAGSSQSLSSGNQDAIILKCTPNGAFLDAIAFGGGLQDHGYEVIIDPNGFYLLHSGQSFGPGGRAVGLAFFDFSLNMIWNKMYGEFDQEGSSDIVSLSATTFLTSGRTESYGAERGFLMQLNNQGDIDWVKTVNLGAGVERITDLLLLPDLSYLVTISSTTIDKPIIARFNAAHQLVWAKTNPQATGGTAIFSGECLMQNPGGSIRAVLGFEGLGAGQSDIELIQFDATDGPCGWENVSLDVEDVVFLSEDVVPDEAVGGGLTDYLLIRNDLSLIGESIDDCEIDCELEGEFILETACLGAELDFNYLLDVPPTNGLNWEWTINTVVYTDSVPAVTISASGNLDISLVLSNDSIDDCVMLLDTIIPVITIPDFDVIGPDFGCEGDEALYEVTIASVDLVWMNGSLADEIIITLNMDTLVQVFVDIQGCIDSAQLAVNVDQMPMGTISGPVLLCSADEVVEYTVDATDYQSILWNNGGTGLSSDYLVNQDTLITVELVNGLCSSEDELAVQIIVIPILEITGPDVVCEGDEVSFQLNTDEGDIIWMNGNLGNQLDIQLTMDSILEVFVDVEGCIDSTEFQVTVNQMPMGEISGPELLCSDDEIVIYSVDATDYTSILWNNGSTSLTSNYLINQDTLITIELINGLCTSNDEFDVQSVVIPDFDIEAPDVVCEGEEVDISLTVDAGDLTWMNGDVGDILSIVLTMDTLIQVYVDVQGCLDSAAVLVSVDNLPTGNLVGDQLVCPGEIVGYSIDAVGQQSILWSNGSTGLSSVFLIDQDTVVSLEMVNGVCLVEEFIAVQVIPEIEVDLSSPSILCIGIEHKLMATGGLDYEWSTGEVGESIIVILDQDTTIWVESGNGCMTDSASVDIVVIDSQASAIEDVQIEVEYNNTVLVDFPEDIPFDLIDAQGALLCDDCFDYTFNLIGNESYVLSHLDEYECLTEIPFDLSPAPCTEVYLPNSFTPNEDRVNDHFRPVCYEPCIDFYHLRIFDRLGLMVFESFDVSGKWSGEGAESENYYSADQVYSYRLLYSLADSFDVVEKLGSVTVVR